ncbi:MAG: leucyl/phenylalanyl-tRNA--protein transferase [Chitinophagaceae bacterium]|nr:leucyl/phenylalanyl-tRNA--protein transferase [Chitinophagaceae bacterium]
MKSESFNLVFPDVEQADEDGLLCIGGNLNVETLLLAYQSGIFPWYNDGEPILWWSPNPRMVLFPKKLKISKSAQQIFNKNKFEITYNNAFESVIKACSNSKRKEGDGTWINNEMIDAYVELHKKGIAISVEVWQEKKLVGGLYGVDLGSIFCGESMFSLVSNASKIGFIHLVKKLENKNYKLIDCQVYTEHLEKLGAEMISRELFLKILKPIV